VVRLLLIVLLVELGLSLLGVVLGMLGASLAELLISRHYIRPSLLGRLPFDSRPLWAFATPLFLMGLALRLFEKLDLLALKALGGSPEQAGFYGAAQNLALLPGLLSLSISPVLLSVLGRALRSGSMEPVKDLARDALRAVILVFPVAGLIAGSASEIIDLVFGPRFAPAAGLLAPLVFGSSAMLMISVASVILTAGDRPVWALVLSAPLVPLALLGHLAAIPALGPLGAALVTLAASVLGAVAQVLAVHHFWDIRPPAATACRGSLACAAAAALAVLWPAPGVLLLLKLPVIGLTVLLILLVLGEFSSSEIAAARWMVLGRFLHPQDPVQLS
jgi:O-antigen/teichoic acid export membrane protein